ncbi:MAG: dihydrodipicolinate reductase [Rhodobacteraceae bacterium]|nr:dihydrodipicolinate reductase [Paracoccaceae bacterium]
MLLNRVLPALVSTVVLAGAADAEGYVRIADRETFLDTVANRELRYGMFGIALRVLPDGRIAGEAMGWGVTGTWEWRDGYFCREMDWSGTPIPPNCQLVETSGERVRFTVDRGAGRSAAFALR